MRPVLAAQLCLSVFQAFLLAPAQHVHDSDAEDGGHEHATIVHSHFSAHSVFPVRPGEPAITESEEKAAWALDTFTVVLPAGPQPALPARTPDLLFVPRVAPGVVALVEERAHDPPARAFSIPRAPPV